MSVLSVLSSLDAAGERVSENWKCQFCLVQMPQVRVSENWKCQFCPVQLLQVKESVIHIPQMKQSVRTGNICSIRFRYHK